MKGRWSGRILPVGALALLLSFSPGCTYMYDRGADALEILDFGVTWSKEPYGSLSVCLLGLASIGAGKMDGGFFGIGGGRAGVMRHYQRNIGLLLWSYDEVGWGDKVDPDDPDTLYRYYIGPIGWFGYPERLPDYSFA
ncbi:MAG: hypothetical protein V2A76_11765 [Planctomycetota bacterium]